MRVVESFVLLALAAVSGVLPVFRLQAPTGSFQVGTTVQPVPGEPGLSLQIWYPAASESTGKHAPYLPGGTGWRARILGLVRTAAIWDAPSAASDKSYPALIYISGWGGGRGENTGLLQDLASRGYVVAASDQPAGLVDGADLSAPMDYSSAAAASRTEGLAAVKLRVQAALASRVLDALLAPGGRFSRQIDPGRVGILGFSFGGATAAEASIDDPRFRAVVNIDGLLFGVARSEGVKVPYLELSDDTEVTEADLNDPDPARRTLARAQWDDERQVKQNLARNGGAYLRVLGALHSNFSDYPVLIPIRRYNGAGVIPPRRAAEIMDTAVAGWFDHYQRGLPLPDLAALPSTALETWPGPQ